MEGGLRRQERQAFSLLSPRFTVMKVAAIMMQERLRILKLNSET